MRNRADGDSVAKKLAAIPDRSRAELVEMWIAAYRKPPPKGLSRRLLEYAAAYHLQVKAFGGLKPSTRRKLRQLAGSNSSSAKPLTAPAKAKFLSPGTRLVREWRGKTHTVEVIEGAFLCDGQRYRSLSEVARAITGARWSGPRFFGL
jgi:hypothetical protein